MGLLGASSLPLEKLGVLQVNMSSRHVVICDTWENALGPAINGYNSIRAHLSVHTGTPLPSSSVVFKCAISPCLATCIALHVCYFKLPNFATLLLCIYVH